MSNILNKLNFFSEEIDLFSKSHGIRTNENRDWERSYRQRWQHDKIVRSTHGVNCTGSCSWKIYVKRGFITWETQATDYPRTRYDLPNHEPRGCQRGASYSWYIYSSTRLKYPLIRGPLFKLWKDLKHFYTDPVETWKAIVENSENYMQYKSTRGLGGFVRINWDEVTEIIAAANIYTIKKYGPDRIVGFSPIPAMSMVSYAAGSRYLSLIGGVCLSFYDWYCDLPPSSPQVWGEQTDVPESADWYNSSYIILWGSNVPQTRTPDAHFFTEARYNGTKAVVITPDYSEASKLSDWWLSPQQGTDSALAMAMGHVILKEFYLNENTKSLYFESYVKRYSDMPLLVLLKKNDNHFFPDRFIRASDFNNNLGIENNPDWKTVVIDKNTNDIAVLNGSVGTRWGEQNLWNLFLKDVRTGLDVDPEITFLNKYDEVQSVAFPYFASDKKYNHFSFSNTIHEEVLYRNVPVKKLKIKNKDLYVATVFDLLVANYGIDRGLGGGNVASSYYDDIPYTPCWQEKITKVDKNDVIQLAKEFALNAAKTEGRSMIIIGAAMNHWYHMDMNYRGVINLLIMCGCIGKSGGGWCHYVGQEKLRPQAGWLPLAFALDWSRPPRQMNGTSFFYNHTSQWRYEKLTIKEILSPLADYKKWNDVSIIDCNVRAERMGWLPSCPQLEENPINLARSAVKQGIPIVEYIINRLRDRSLKMSCEDPDNLKNYPRNLFVWRSNLLGSSGKGHEYFLKYFLGTQHGVLGKDLGALGMLKPKEVIWRDVDSRGKLDLLVTLDFRMSTTCLYSDIVLPTASYYEKDDLNTSDMHPFIHPLQAAIDPVWESKTDWEIYKSIARKFSTLVVGHLGIEKDIVLVPLLHDTPSELGQALCVKEWYKNECDLIPGKTMPSIFVVERNYPDTYKKFVSLGPLLAKLGNNVKGVSWDTLEEVEGLKLINKTVTEIGVSFGLPKIETAIDAAEVILSLAPETNGHVATKSWSDLSKTTGIDHTHLSIHRMHDKITFRDVAAQPRKIISSPTWSGIESEEVSYNAGYTNVHELIPWRTLTGRQQLYQDHAWMCDFGESLSSYKPGGGVCVEAKGAAAAVDGRSGGSRRRRRRRLRLWGQPAVAAAAVRFEQGLRPAVARAAGAVRAATAAAAGRLLRSFGGQQ
jgi:nitrate reductase alpha subunit